MLSIKAGTRSWTKCHGDLFSLFLFRLNAKKWFHDKVIECEQSSYSGGSSSKFFVESVQKIHMYHLLSMKFNLLSMNFLQTFFLGTLNFDKEK